MRPNAGRWRRAAPENFFSNDFHLQSSIEKFPPESKCWRLLMGVESLDTGKAGYKLPHLLPIEPSSQIDIFTNFLIRCPQWKLFS